MRFHFCCFVLALAVSSSTAVPEPCIIPDVNHGEVGNYITRKYTRNRSRECFYELQPGESVDNSDSVILRCEKGFLPAGIPQISKVLRFKEDVVTCEDGAWSKPLLCEAEISCGEPPPIQFATVTILFPGDYPLGAIVAYECQPGYIIKGRSTTSQCVLSHDGSQAVWTKAPMSCAANISSPFVPTTKISSTTPIPEPGKRQNEQECSCTYNSASVNTAAYAGHEKLLPGSNIEKGSVVRFTCEHQEMILMLPTGIRVSGSVNMTCDKCQIWQEGDVPFCAPRNKSSCDGEPPPIKNGRSLVSKRSHGHVIYYRCDDFAVKVKLGRVECFYGTWRGDPPVCADTRCYTERLDFPGLVQPNEEFLAHGKSFKIVCEEGYEARNLQMGISCEMGKWEIISNPCIKVPPSISRCPEIDDEGVFTIKYSNGKQINSVAEYNCKSVSQKVLGSNTRICQQNGEWSGSDPVCVDTTCSEFMVSGSLSVSYSKANKVGSRAVFHCTPPSVLVGSRIARCRVSGIWTHPQPTCDESKLRCSVIDEKGIFTLRYSNDRKVNSVAHYSCKEHDHKIWGSNVRDCQENGEWSGVDPECVASGCPMEALVNSLPPNIVLNDEDMIGEFVPSGLELGLFCEDNMALIGNKKVKCNQQGRWNLGNVQCVVGCQLDVTNPPSALIIEPVKDYYRFGEFVLLSCPEGFEFTAEVERVMCMGSGWSDELPDCEKL